MKKSLFLIIVGIIILTGLGQLIFFASQLNDSPPLHLPNIVLGHPTDTSITANIRSSQELLVSLEYGTSPDNYTGRTTPTLLIAEEPVNITINNLLPDRQYFYRLQYSTTEKTESSASNEYSFHTRRAPGNSFTFAIQSDPHLDTRSSPEIYRANLRNILNNRPDFLVDLGDIFITDRVEEKNDQNIQARFLLMRDYYSLITHSVPLFITMSNHDGETGWDFNNPRSELATLSVKHRIANLPNPPQNGNPPGNYYSFVWGDALFVVLDPFRYTTTTEDGWAWTLGREQYDWLGKTLQNNSTKYKFVFIHHLAGGTTYGRGGTEWAKYFEWGGNNADDSYGFTINRPGWEIPIHQLLLQNDVDAVFKGHDHLFAKQELDGIIYQTLPQPSHPGNDDSVAQEIGYVSGDILGGSGYLQIKVATDSATVDFIKADGKPAYSYSIYNNQ